MWSFIPTKAHWRRWSLANKLTCVGTYVGIVALVLTIVFFLWPARSTPIAGHQSNVDTRVDRSPGAIVQTAVDSSNVVQIGSLTVNPDTHKYRPMTQELRRDLETKLAAWSKNYATAAPVVRVECESGNSQRFKVGVDLGEALARQNLGGFDPTSVSIGRFPEYPLTLHCGSNSLALASAFLSAISSYVTGRVNVVPLTQWPESHLRLYLNGTPSFSENGAVNME